MFSVQYLDGFRVDRRFLRCLPNYRLLHGAADGDLRSGWQLSALRERYYHRRNVQDSDEAMIAPDSVDAGTATLPTLQTIRPAREPAAALRGPTPSHMTLVENKNRLLFYAFFGP